MGILSMLIGMGTGMGLYITVVIILKRRRKRYGRIFHNWIEKGHCILKTENLMFILCFYTKSGGVGVCCLDEEHYHYFNMRDDTIGQIIAKKEAIHGIKVRKFLKPISKEEFVNELIRSDHIASNEIDKEGCFIFSFDTVDMDLLPDWVTAELVAKKLEES